MTDILSFDEPPDDHDLRLNAAVFAVDDTLQRFQIEDRFAGDQSEQFYLGMATGLTLAQRLQSEMSNEAFAESLNDLVNATSSLVIAKRHGESTVTTKHHLATGWRIWGMKFKDIVGIVLRMGR